VGKSILHAQVQDAQDVLMHECSNGSGLSVKPLHIAAVDRSTQHFDGSWCFQVNMLAQVDLSKTPDSKQTHEAVVPELLADPIRHDAPLLLNATHSPLTLVYRFLLFSSTAFLLNMLWQHCHEFDLLPGIEPLDKRFSLMKPCQFIARK
jgi:hypothetical protein